MLVATYDDASGIITTRYEGLPDQEAFDSYVPILTKFMNKSVAMHGAWLHFVDGAGKSVQTKESAGHIEAYWNEKAREDGYTAYVVTSALAKMQIDRMRQNVKKGFFVDESAARAWLLERGRANVALAKP